MYGKKQMMALALSAVLTVTAVGPVLASELEDRLNNIQQQMQVQQNQAAQAQQQVDSVAGQLRKIQTELDSA